jgi:hypothetical protein
VFIKLRKMEHDDRILKCSKNLSKKKSKITTDLSIITTVYINNNLTSNQHTARINSGPATIQELDQQIQINMYLLRKPCDPIYRADIYCCLERVTIKIIKTHHKFLYIHSF